jgi:hypothetical protein
VHRLQRHLSGLHVRVQDGHGRVHRLQRHLSGLHVRVQDGHGRVHRLQRHLSGSHGPENVTQMHRTDARAPRSGPHDRLSALHTHSSSSHARVQTSPDTFFEKVIGPREEFALRLGIPL